jgi:hypothetical protein
METLIYIYRVNVLLQQENRGGNREEWRFIPTSFGLLHLYFLYIFNNISFSVEYAHVTGVFFVVEEKRRIFHAFFFIG